VTEVTVRILRKPEMARARTDRLCQLRRCRRGVSRITGGDHPGGMR